MEFAEQANRLGDFAAIALEPTVVIVQLDAAEATEHAIEDAAGQHFVPRVMANGFPTADQVVAFVDLFQEPRNLVGIVLQVGVHREDDVALSRTSKPTCNATALPRLLRKRRPRTILGKMSARAWMTAHESIGAAVVNEDDFDSAIILDMLEDAID